ncbi:hemolysin-III related-domain-containing protein [Chytridium lagenaria]|nr:hemolysin-III related-domain-containing protein [Chytridium lagenaria]
MTTPVTRSSNDHLTNLEVSDTTDSGSGGKDASSASTPTLMAMVDKSRSSGNSKDIAIPLEPSIAQMTPAPSSTTVVMEAEGEDSRPYLHAAFEAIGKSYATQTATPTPVIVIKDADDEGDDSPKCREEALRRGTKYMDTTVHYRNMPAWFHDDVYILTGYRRIQFTYRGCFRSLFYIHNETGNVYTHLIGTVFFARSSSSSSTAPLSPNDTIIIITTSVPTAISTTFSSRSHHYGVSSYPYSCGIFTHLYTTAWNKADYVGIVFLIVGSFIPAVYYGFYCYRTLQLIYIPTMVFFGLATAIVTMSKRFSTPKYRYLRTTLFLALGLAGVVPLAHVLIIYKPEFAAEAMALRYVGAMGLMYILGAALYASRVPERWFPGKFDIWFQSHQLFHVLVVMAAVTHYIGLMKAYRFWHESGVRCDQL